MNILSSPQYKTPVSRTEFKEIKTELYFAVEDALVDRRLTVGRLWTLLGMTNFYCWAVAHKWGALQSLEDGLEVDSDRLNALIAASDAGLVEISSSAEWVGKYLAKNWEKACRGARLVRYIRQFMAELGIFQFIPGIQGQTVTSIVLEKVDFARLLILHEVCEQILLKHNDCPESTCDDNGNWHHPQNIDIMPKHRGITGVMLFNAVFKGIAEYNRQDDGEEKVVERLSPVLEFPQPKPKYWEWKPAYKIPFGAWTALLRKQLLQEPKELICA